MPGLLGRDACTGQAVMPDKAGREIGTDGIYLLNEGRTGNVYKIMEIVERLQ
jgi:hypothetical protein